MAGSSSQIGGRLPPAITINAAGRGPFVLACDHASNRIPEPYGDLMLTPRQRFMHIAWDPGALGVAMLLSELLDAPLIHSTVCRLVIDCNRDLDAHDLIPIMSERTEIVANKGLGDGERQNRIRGFHAPFHAAIDKALSQRAAAGEEAILVTVHSFTPTYKDVWRPWPIGLIHGDDPDFCGELREALLADEPELNVGWNEPYSAKNGVTYTLEHHGDGRGLESAMIEIRHDEILEPAGVANWAHRLARCLDAARSARQVTAAIPTNRHMGQTTGGTND